MLHNAPLQDERLTMTSDNSDLPQSPGRLTLRNLLLKIKNRLTGSPRETSTGELQPGDRSGTETAEQEMIRGVMGLASKNVREIMIPRVDVVAVSSTISLNALVKVIDDAGHSRIPVYNETIDNISGILYVKELLPFIAHKPRKFELRKMLHRPYFVPETMPLDDLLVEFKRRRLHLSCVVDEYGGFGGIITLEDIIEEIVGDIKDEFDDDEAPEIRKIGRNSFEVDSRMTL
ncbi:MAG: HlyC/CorC family transporter, partial [Spirochaetales bacterium]